MPKFRKKPVEIEAYQIPPYNHEATREAPPSWLVDALVSGNAQACPGGGVEIKTLEGTMLGEVGDWVIRGVKGELYPCKPDVFAATYDQAAGEPMPCWCPYCEQPHSVAQRHNK
jgi:hypothetical protein